MPASTLRAAIFLGLGSLGALGTLCAPRAEEFASWSHHAELLINTSASGGNTAVTVTGFPLLVRLTAADFPFSEAKGKGEDMRFSSAAGRILDFQIERWDSANGTAEIWVEMDTVKANTAGQTFKMHWGNAGARAWSNGGAVFDNATGSVGVWHLGGSGQRPNSAPNGNPAFPHDFSGDGSRPGVIGRADTLGGGNPASYLDIGDGYAALDSGFTFSAWVNPVSGSQEIRILDLGNGAAQDNIAVARLAGSETLAFSVRNGSDASKTITADGALASNQWQLIAVTVSGDKAVLYRNGIPVVSETLTRTIPHVYRKENFLGKSNRPGDGFFQGKLDEVRLEKVPRGESWLKLSYENQRPDQNVVSFKNPIGCAQKFAAPADTSVAEGGSLDLIGTAQCADHWLWSAASGPVPRILDPEVKILHVTAPRVSGDTVIRYQFTATYGAQAKSGVVTVRIRETIPDPDYTLPADLTWDGKDALILKPEWKPQTFKALDARPLHYVWTAPVLETDTAVTADGLKLFPTAKQARMLVRLCVDNGGAEVCREIQVWINLSPVALRANPSRGGKPRNGSRPRWDASGRIPFQGNSAIFSGP